MSCNKLEAEINIRKAIESDSALIHSMIVELAQFEELMELVKSTPESISDLLFGENKVADALIAEYNGKTAGLALFYKTISTFAGKKGIYLEDLYVKSEFRGFGVGKNLLRELARIAKATDCCRLDWAVLDWNTKAKSFYEGIGAKRIAEWELYRMEEKAIDDFIAEK